MLMFFRQSISRFKDEHVTSVLECSAKLGGVQSELEIYLTVRSPCLGVILYSVNINDIRDIFTTRKYFLILVVVTVMVEFRDMFN